MRQLADCNINDLTSEIQKLGKQYYNKKYNIQIFLHKNFL